MKDSGLDRLIFSLLTRNLGHAEIAGYAQAVERQEASAVAKTFQSIDAKATGLLTHVSMMIAGLGLVAPLVASSDIELAVIIVEMSVYLLLAVGCLRCLSIFAGRDLAGAHMEERLARELIIRRELLSWCNWGSIVVTVIVFVLLPIQFLYAPPK